MLKDIQNLGHPVVLDITFALNYALKTGVKWCKFQPIPLPFVTLAASTRIRNFRSRYGHRKTKEGEFL